MILLKQYQLKQEGRIFVSPSYVLPSTQNDWESTHENDERGFKWIEKLAIMVDADEEDIY
jgi:hypothetical protein